MFMRYFLYPFHIFYNSKFCNLFFTGIKNLKPHLLIPTKETKNDKHGIYCILKRSNYYKRTNYRIYPQI
jgi:hypothetical protein